MAPRTKGRVVLGKNPKDNLDAAKALLKKHTEMGANSPLKLLQDVDWSALEPKIDAALDAHESAETHKAKMEEQYAARDAEMPEVLKAVKQSIALLKASFGDNPKKLGDWGIEVDDTPQAKTPKKKE